MGIFSKIKQNIVGDNEAKRNPIIIKERRYSWDEVKEEYFKIHKGLTWIERIGEFDPIDNIIVKIDNTGYFFTDIVMLNRKRRFEEIKNILFESKKITLKWTDYCGDLISIWYAVKSKEDVEKKLKLSD